MTKGYKNYDPKTKARIALEAIRGEESLLAICAANKISKTSAMEWRDKLIAGADSIFTPTSEQHRLCNKLKQEIEVLHRVLGETVAENNFFKKKLSA